MISWIDSSYGRCITPPHVCFLCQDYQNAPAVTSSDLAAVLTRYRDSTMVHIHYHGVWYVEALSRFGYWTKTNSYATMADLRHAIRRIDKEE